MKSTTSCLAAVVLLLLGGCDGTLREQQGKELRRLESSVAALKREKEDLCAKVEQAGLDSAVLRAENTSLETRLYGLRSENESLKRQLESERAAAARQIEQLKQELAAARQVPSSDAAGVPGPSPTPAAKSPLPAPSDSAKEVLIAETQNRVADLAAQIAELTPKVAQARAKVTNLIRTTLDTPMVPPPGGFIRDGQMYRRDLTCGRSTARVYPYYYGHVHDASCYTDTPIGPAVRAGDFRSAHEKDKAIQAAKEENLPSEKMLLDLRNELEKAKQELGRLRTADKPK